MGYRSLVDFHPFPLTKRFPITPSAIQLIGTPSIFCINKTVPGFLDVTRFLLLDVTVCDVQQLNSNYTSFSASRTVLFGQGNRNSNFCIFLLDLHNNPDQLLNQQSLYYSKKCSFKSDINPLCHLVHSESSGDVERNCRLSLVGLKLDSQERLPCFLHII